MYIYIYRRDLFLWHMILFPLEFISCLEISFEIWSVVSFLENGQWLGLALSQVFVERGGLMFLFFSLGHPRGW